MAVPRFLTAIIVLAGLATGAAVDGATASTRALLPLPYAAQALSAYGGYVVFSQSDPNQNNWRLMVWHAGRVSALPIASRSIPFDADVGPDVRGRPAVVYSQCSTDPSGLFQVATPIIWTIGWTNASECRIYELSLVGGRGRLVKQIYARGSSDSTPSIWKGAIAFARISASRPNVARVMLWRPGRPAHELPGGTLPCMTCPAGFPGPPGAWVSAMDLGPQALAFSWVLSGENVLHGIALEMRIDPMGGGRPRIADAGVGQEACTGGESSSVSSPNADGAQIFYVVEIGDPCVGDSSTFETFAPSTGRWRSVSPSGGIIGAAAQDGGNTYWIQVKLGPPPPPPDRDLAQNQGDCLPQHETCTLMQTKNLVLRPDPHHYRPYPPVR